MSSARQEARQRAWNTPPAKTSDAEGQAFGKRVFHLEAMRRRLPKDVYLNLASTIRDGKTLDPAIADVVANAMKDWAMELGATHYTHWFQPMTGHTAEKHDSFLSAGPDGQIISEFSGDMLISGEPDASSFPSGGLRSTFEARGYTAWDPTVPAFVITGPQGGTLHIPSYFYSYAGDALDRKIPLQRSISALSQQALRILRLFGNESATDVRPMVGAEQEFFLVDKNLAALRPDLMLTGRTLLGSPSPKGQELEDHYFGAIPPRVMSFLQDLERELLALGIPVKTRHNEVAPGQFEIAPVYEDANIACDHNMLTMNLMQHLASRHGFVCLLHEKPFAGVNGSGKHNNWSLQTSEGQNLLNPGKTPGENAQFLVFLAAVLRAIHKYAPALRLGTVGAGNDHRLGANEAPPAILSVYLGEQLNQVLADIIQGNPGGDQAPQRPALEIGVSTLPPLPVDMSDRNRTSPFAYTGNKFEFRAVGSSQSIAPANIALNAAVACALEEIATELESAVKGGASLNGALQELLPRLFREHIAVIFNGNGYSQEWPEEARRRELPNYTNTVDAVQHYSDAAVMEVFARQNVLTEREMLARQQILLENYATSVIIEAHTLADMLRTLVLPPAREATAMAAAALIKVREAAGEGSARVEEQYFREVQGHVTSLHEALSRLEEYVQEASQGEGALARAQKARDMVLPAMAQCREHADALERLLDEEQWALPSYAEMLWIH